MARIGFLAHYDTGHVNPSTVLGRALQAAGHQILFFNIPDTEEKITHSDLQFVALGEQEYPLGTLAAQTRRRGELFGLEVMKDYFERVASWASITLQQLPGLLHRHPVDLLVIDQVNYAGPTVAEHLGIPFVSLANALLLNREDTVPPPVLPMPYDASEAGVARNREGWAMVDAAHEPLLALVNRQRAAWGLAAYSNVLEDPLGQAAAQISQQVPALEFPRPQAPASLHLIGPLRDSHASNTTPFDWEWFDGRPIVYASCGTLQNGLKHVFKAMIAACAPLDAQTVIALGKGALTPADFGEVPANIKLVAYAPQTEILARATLCITHAGLNTTSDCLAAGVPMVAIPIATEQPGIAMRIAYLGAGTVILLDQLSPETLSAAIHTVLHEPSYRAAAQLAAASIQPLRPAKEAVRLIEQVLAEQVLVEQTTASR